MARAELFNRWIEFLSGQPIDSTDIPDWCRRITADPGLMLHFKAADIALIVAEMNSFCEGADLER